MLFRNVKRPFFFVLGLLLLAVIALSLIALSPWGFKQRQSASLSANLLNVTPTYKLASQIRFDVIVLGSEPEGVSAAVAAAETGASVLLLSEEPRVGGLFVMGQMNSLDLRTEPEVMQRGIFERWWNLVGRGSSFDVNRAEAAFQTLLNEAGVVVGLNGEITPVLNAQGTGIESVIFSQPDFGQENELFAAQYIDATAEADVAADVGVPFSMGFSSMGLDARMVDTLVFRIDNIDWQALRRGINQRGTSYAEVNDRVAWGHFAENGQSLIKRYQAQEDGIRLRGLNLGLQDDGTVLVNALLIHDIDPFDPASREEGKARATREAVRIIDFLKAEGVPGFNAASFGGVAQSLYIRETRHMETLCKLTVDDVLGNKVTSNDIAAGGYPLDVQVLTRNDTGFVYGVPDVYGAELCISVPTMIDNLWIVGKAAGYDPLAASSARVVPFGMAVAEAVGVAAVRALQAGYSPLELASNADEIANLRATLKQRGAYFATVRNRPPTGPYQHTNFEAYKVMRSRALALGGYNNQPKLDEKVKSIGYVYLLSNVAKRFAGDAFLGQSLIAAYPDSSTRLSSTQALDITKEALCLIDYCNDGDLERLLPAKALQLSPEVTRGQIYELAAGVASLLK